MKKRLLAIILSLVCVISLAQPAYAAAGGGETAAQRLNASKYCYQLPSDSRWEFVTPALKDRLSVRADGKTATLFAPGITAAGGWKDTDKHWDKKDDNLCWAAADANLISWYLDTAEAAGADLGDLQRWNMDIFDNQFRDIWRPDEGFDMNNGLSWYFTGRFTNAPGDPAFNPPTLTDPDEKMMLNRNPGGFLHELPHVGSAFLPLYPEISYPDRYEDMRCYHGDTETKFPFTEVLDQLTVEGGNLYNYQNFSDNMIRALKYGAAGLTVKGDGTLSGGHAVTLWGADYDVETGKIKRIYITDSDDKTEQLRPVGVTAREPDENGIRLTNFNITNGDGKWTKIADTVNLFAYGAVQEKTGNVTLRYTAPEQLQVGTAISPLLPVVSGGRTPYTYTATGTLPAGLTFKDGKITGTPAAAGAASSVTVTLTDADDKQASCTIQFPAVSKGVHSMQADFKDQTVFLGTKPAAQTALSTTGTVRYRSSAPAVVSVDEATGALTVHKAGQATITASVAGDQNRAGVSATYQITVKNAPADITITPDKNSPVGGKLQGSTQDILSRISFTEEEQQLIDSGKPIQILLTARDISGTVSSEDQALMKKAADGETVALYWDISLTKDIDGEQSAVHTTDGELQISVTVPEELRRSGRTYRVLRLHDGEVTVLESSYDSATHQLTFKTDRFSTYALSYADEATPKTGDSSHMALWGGLTMAAACGAAYVVLHQRRKKEQDQ